METPIGVHGLEVLTLIFLKGLPITLFLVVVGWFLREASPRLRTVYWTCGLLGLGVLPFLTIHGPVVGSGPVPFPESWVQPGSGGPSLASWAALVWAAGAMVFLLRFARDVVAAWLEGRTAEPWRDPSVASLLDDGRRQLGIRRGVRLRLSSSCRIPLNYGWLRPVILLPTSALEWPRARLRAVIHHELSHVARHDSALALLGAVLEALHWPNPVLWRITARLRADQELACDANVVRDVTEPTAYARHLVGVARSLLGSDVAPRTALSLARPSTLRERVRYVLSLKAGGPSSASGLRSVAAAGVFVLLLSGGIAVTSPWQPCEGMSPESPAPGVSYLSQGSRVASGPTGLPSLL